MGRCFSSLVCFSVSHSHCAILPMQTAFNSHDLMGMYPCIPTLDGPLPLCTLSQLHIVRPVLTKLAHCCDIISCTSHRLPVERRSWCPVWNHSHWFSLLKPHYIIAVIYQFRLFHWCWACQHQQPCVLTYLDLWPLLIMFGPAGHMYRSWSNRFAVPCSSKSHWASLTIHHGNLWEVIEF